MAVFDIIFKYIYMVSCSFVSYFVLIYCNDSVYVGVSGAMMPSLLSVIYLIVFLAVTVCWSLMIRFNMKAYGILKIVMFFYLMLHMVALYLCQLGPIQEWLDKDTDHFVSRFDLQCMFRLKFESWYGKAFLLHIQAHHNNFFDLSC